MPRALLLIVLPHSLCLPVFAQDNPITNGSLEAVGANGVPTDWELLGTVSVVPTAHSGKNTLLPDRTENGKVETGLNREWKINSGEQGKLLAELKGGLEFWYQAPAAGSGARLMVGLIAMSSAPLEGTGAARAMYEVPQSHVGDGKWHRGLVKYDFTDKPLAKWVHVAARIYGGTGQLLLDDLKWVPAVGPLPKVQKLTLVENPGQEGEACTLKAQVTNVGDQPMQAAQAQIVLPDYLKTTAAARRRSRPLRPMPSRRFSGRSPGCATARTRSPCVSSRVSRRPRAASNSLPTFRSSNSAPIASSSPPARPPPCASSSATSATR